MVILFRLWFIETRLLSFSNVIYSLILDAKEYFKPYTSDIGVLISVAFWELKQVG